MARNSPGAAGATNFIDLGVNFNTLGCTSAVSVSIWQWPAISSTLSQLAEDNTTSSIEVVTFFQVALAFWGRITTTISGVKTVTGGTMAVATWSNQVLTYDGSTIALFGNGSSVATIGATGSLVTTITNTIKVFRRGDDLTNNYLNWNGRLADLAIWNVGLTATEAGALAKGARPNTVRPSSLVGWWPLDGLVSPEPDLSGLVNNGTVTGTTTVTGPPVMPFTPRWPQVNSMIMLPAAGVGWLVNRRNKLMVPKRKIIKP